MTKVDLHELVKLPHGKAKAVLVWAGLWDEDAGKEEKQYSVTLDVEYREFDTVTVTVSARSEDEAAEKAEAGYLEDSDATKVEAVKVEEL